MGLFADALYGDGTQGSGDQAKLFKDMEAGKVKLDEIRKVIQYMGTLTKEDLISRMLNTPEKKLNKLRNAWHRFVMQINDAGFLDAMIFALDTLADAIVGITKGFKIILPLLKEMWSIVKPMLTLWATVWGVKKIQQLTTTMRALAVSVGLVSAAGNAGILGGLGRSKFTKLIARVGLLKTAIFYARKAWILFGATVKRSFIAVGILALIDMLETLQGKRTVLTQLMQDGGLLGGIATTLVAAFRTMQVAVEIIIAALHALFTNDWSMFSGFVEDSISRWRQSMNSLFPFDKWFAHFKALGKLVLGVMSPVTAMGAIAEYSRFKEASANWNQQSAMKSPALLARPNPYVSSGGYTAPTPATINFNPSITINGSGLNQSQLESTINNVLTKQVTQAKANYSMAR